MRLILEVWLLVFWFRFSVFSRSLFKSLNGLHWTSRCQDRSSCKLLDISIYYNRVQKHSLCHNERDGVSNHQHHDYLLNRLFKAQIKENIKAPRHWPLCGEFTGPGEFPAQRTSNAEKVSIWWRYHLMNNTVTTKYDLSFVRPKNIS